MNFEITAPGKLILLGEYAVLENSPAIVAALDRKVLVNFEKNQNNGSSLSLPHLNAVVPLTISKSGITPHLKKETQPVAETTRSVVSLLNRIADTNGRFRSRLRGMRLSIDSSDFFADKKNRKFGLGSSAAVTVGVLSAAQSLSGETMPQKHALLSQAYNLHNESQNQPGSGIDVAACIYGGVLRYQLNSNESVFSPQIKKLFIPEDLQMRFVWTGRPASTASLLRDIAEFKKRQSREYYRISERLGCLAWAGCEAFENRQTETFLYIVQRYHCRLKELGQRSQIPIISKEHEQIAEIVYRNGGYYKPSGAGGGDFGIVFSSDRKLIDDVCEAVASAGFVFPDFNLCTTGVNIN